MVAWYVKLCFLLHYVNDSAGVCRLSGKKDVLWTEGKLVEAALGNVLQQNLCPGIHLDVTLTGTT